jgi:hypothetical protein
MIFFAISFLMLSVIGNMQFQTLDACVFFHIIFVLVCDDRRGEGTG